MAHKQTIHQMVAAIAKQHMHFETLDSRGRDCLDFKEVEVSSAKRALIAAYEAGQQNAAGQVYRCTGCGALLAHEGAYCKYPGVDCAREDD